MKLDLHTPTPLEYFSCLVADDQAFPFFEAAASIAHDEYPELDVQQVLSDVDQLVARLKRRIPQDAGALQRLRVLQQFFYSDLGFGGNTNNFYEPDNSFVHAVLRTRRGIPISLAAIWLELAQAIGLRAYGVSFPGHFLVKLAIPGGDVVINPLNGHSFSREELAERLEPYTRRSGLAAEFDAPLSLFLQAASPRDIIVRMLRNLKEMYKAQSDWPRVLAVQNRLIATTPQAWTEYRDRDRGLTLVEMNETVGGMSAAVPDLELYVSKASDALDCEAMSGLLAALRSGLAH